METKVNVSTTTETILGEFDSEDVYKMLLELSQKGYVIGHKDGHPYTSLFDVLDRALSQAVTGKGAERHGNGLPFEEQPMQTICTMLGTNHFALGQAIKKIVESSKMDKDKAVHELLGAINYVAGAIVWLENNND